MHHVGDDNFKGEESKEKPAEGEVSSQITAAIQWNNLLFFSYCPTKLVISYQHWERVKRTLCTWQVDAKLFCTSQKWHLFVIFPAQGIGWNYLESLWCHCSFWVLPKADDKNDPLLFLFVPLFYSKQKKFAFFLFIIMIRCSCMLRIRIRDLLYFTFSYQSVQLALWLYVAALSFFLFFFCSFLYIHVHGKIIYIWIIILFF